LKKDIKREKNYFKNIQGLRALAIILVFAYHLDHPFFQGGYLGVDIFFVISGFVISLNINHLIKNNNFSITSFFYKRILRILPSVISISLLCFLIAFFYFSPNQFKDTIKVIFSSLSFFSNYYFAFNNDYFDNISKFQPMLHTWSVSLEIQLYLVFGLIAYYFYKINAPKKEAYLLISIFLLSIIGSQLSGNLKLETPFIEEEFEFFNQSKYFSFYFIFGRLWEFLAGVFLFKGYKKILVNKSFLKFQNKIFFSSLIMILIAVYMFNEKTPTPSFLTLIPVILTCFLILSSMKLERYNIILENKILNFIGKISFSIYLFHFPLIVLYKIYFNSVISLNSSIMIIMITLFFSTINFYLVENRFRIIKSYFKITALVSALTVSIIVGFFFSKNNIHKNFYFSNFSEKDNKQLEMISEAVSSDGYKNMFSNGKCIFWKKNSENLKKSIFTKCLNKHKKLVLFIGDSHGMDNYNSFARNLIKESFIISLADGNCVPHKKQCDMNKILNFVKTNRKNIKAVIYSEKGSNLINKKILNNKVDKNLEFLNNLSNYVRVIWLGSRNEPDIQLKYFAKLEKYFKKFENPEIKILDEYLITIQKNNKFEYVSFLKNIDYNFEDDFKVDDKFITYSDGSHLSVKGEKYFGKKLLEIDKFNLLFND